MDGWNTNAAQNWAAFIAIGGGLVAYYYLSHGERPSNAARVRPQPTAAPNVSTKSSKSGVSKPSKKTSSASAGGKKEAKNAPEKTSEPVKDNGVRRKVETSASAAKADNDASDRDVKDFAAWMTQARNGVEVKKAGTNSDRLKTVKQSSVLNTPAISSGSSHAEADADDHISPAISPTSKAGAVADMLEPVAPGPSVLRITPSEKPAKPKSQDKPRKDGKDAKQSKKARQNERKKEEQKLEREEHEKQRKLLEEKQRRSAREARGEPAKNGIPVGKAPANNAWTAQHPTPVIDAPVETVASNNAALLDTFDAESTGSSNAGASTAATSTTDGAPSQWIDDAPTGHDDMAKAVRESLNDGAWTTAGNKRKQKKNKPSAGSPGNATPNANAKLPPAPRVADGKPTGFQALRDEYEQRTDVDASDAANWDA